MKVRVTLFVGTLATMLAMLCGCAFIGEPASTGDLLVRFAANPNNANFVADGHADLVLSVGGYCVTVLVDGSAQAADGTTHCRVTVDMTALTGETRAYDIYVEQQERKVIGYLNDATGGSKPWNRAEVDLAFAIDIPTVVDILSEAKFMRASYDSDDRVRYDLTLPAASVLDVVWGKGDVTTSFYAVGKEELEDALGDSKLHVCFNEDCLVRSVSLDLDFTFEGKVSVDLDTRVVFDGYGTVDAASLAVPEGVRESSVVTDDPLDLGSGSQLG